MRLLEFSATPLLFKDVLGALQQHFGLERVGGQARVYTVGNQLGVVYLVRGGPQAVGLTWARGTKTVTHIYHWARFNAAHSPDLVIDLPPEATTNILPAIVDFVQNPHTGALNEDLAEPVAEPVETPQPAPTAAPAPVEPAPAPAKIVIMARSASGELFEVPGLEQTARAIEARIAKASGSSKTMEQQYDELRAKIELVVSGKSHNIKSLLIYGAPSSGKTFTVMQVVKALGLQEGVDYVVKKGSITDFAAYRTLISNIDGLVIFDDCDSVVATKVGKNMIKGALDTYPVRDLSYDNANAIDTDSMPTEDRIVFVDAMSRVMRGTATDADLKLFDRYTPDDNKKKKAKKDVYRGKDGVFELPDPATLLAHYGDGSNTERMNELQDYFNRRLPNKIDYRGRMIFISNMGKDEWDSAILTRTFRQYMDFSDDEMLEFIDRIKGTIAAPNLSDDQKAEVINYIRERHLAGALHSPINFRLIQQAFDLRLTSTWQSMIDDL